MKNINFPKTSGKNLNRVKQSFPNDFPGKLTLVLIAFRQHQQLDINTWIPFAEKLEDMYPDVAYVELPVVYRMNPLSQFMLNEGMRAGIPNKKSRERTITLYLDKQQFTSDLGILSEDQIQVFLVGEGGEVLWHETGSFSEEKGSALKQLINLQNHQNKSSIYVN